MKKQRPDNRAATWLPLMIRLTALGYLLFFVPDLVLAATHRIQVVPPFLARLFNWGEGGDAVAVMFATVYIVWAIFLFQSARAPLAHRLFLDFNLTANSAHFTAMLIMALTMPEHRQHAAGVIALGLLTIIPIGACWLPVRGAAHIDTSDNSAALISGVAQPPAAAAPGSVRIVKPGKEIR
jgi:hypothetical protein